MPVTVRPAAPGDADAVRAFTRDTWPERGDYLPDVIEEWIADDDPDRHTLVATVEDAVAGVLQAVVLSSDEAWLQGMRVDPDHRGRGIGTRLTEAAFEWARGRGAVVARNMVFSWNAAGLGLSRAAGFDAVAEFRWAHPAPDLDADPALPVRDDPGAAWHYWQGSDARDALAGLALDLDEPWALADLTRDRLARAAEETALFAVGRPVRAIAFRVRDYERDVEGAPERWADYGVGAWADPAAADALLAAVARDAAALGVDRTRVLLPETPGAVSDAALAGVEVADEPDFVMAADLTGRD